MDKPSQPISDTTKLSAWGSEFAERWNSNSYSVFVLHGNIFDVFPVVNGDKSVAYDSLKNYIAQRFFPNRASVMRYDITEGLTFTDIGRPTGTSKGEFFTWLQSYDRLEKTNLLNEGLPREFYKLAPILRRFFFNVSEQKNKDGRQGVTLMIDFPEKIIPAAEDSMSSVDERMALVSLLKWAVSPELRRLDVGIILLTETASKLQADILQNPYVAQIRLDLPKVAERQVFIESAWAQSVGGGKAMTDWSDLDAVELAARTAGLNLVRIKQLITEAVNNDQRVTFDHVSESKKRLIEEYCQGLVQFKEPDANLKLDAVATHKVAKEKLTQIAWLIRNNKAEVLERGVLLPGRIGVGKSFLVDCFASESGLPVLVIGDFRSKWVGDTDRQRTRILLTIRALGPVIVVVDEADAVFGNRDKAGGDSNGIESRNFAAFAAHIGDSSLRGKELWIAMTSRPDLLAIDMKRRGRFGLCIPLFPAQTPDEVVELFTTVAKGRKMTLSQDMLDFIQKELGNKRLTGSDVGAILDSAKESAVLAKRDNDVRVDDIGSAVDNFIDPLDPDTLYLQELAAVLACSDKRYLPPAYQNADRQELVNAFNVRKRAI